MPLFYNRALHSERRIKEGRALSDDWRIMRGYWAQGVLQGNTYFTAEHAAAAEANLKRQEQHAMHLRAARGMVQP